MLEARGGGQHGGRKPCQLVPPQGAEQGAAPPLGRPAVLPDPHHSFCPKRLQLCWAWVTSVMSSVSQQEAIVAETAFGAPQEDTVAG